VSRLFIASLVVVCVLGHSQELRAQAVSAGFKAGITAARLPGVKDAIEAAVDEESRWGGTGGVFVTVPLNDLVAFQPEALYVVKGETLVSPAVSYMLSFDARYLETPLLFRFGRSSRRLYFLAGPSLGFRLAAEAREVVGGVTETRDFSDQIKRVDVGVSFGAGATLDRFLVEGRWTEGLHDIESADQFPTAVRHRVLAVFAGFRF
jgi:outer membrane protein with beta-barrel domain